MVSHADLAARLMDRVLAAALTQKMADTWAHGLWRLGPKQATDSWSLEDAQGVLARGLGLLRWEEVGEIIQAQTPFEMPPGGPRTRSEVEDWLVEFWRTASMASVHGVMRDGRITWTGRMKNGMTPLGDFATDPFLPALGEVLGVILDEARFNIGTGVIPFGANRLRYQTLAVSYPGGLGFDLMLQPHGDVPWDDAQLEAAYALWRLDASIPAGAIAGRERL